MRCSSSDTQATTKVSLNDAPIPRDITFVRGDQVERKFLLTGICYTPTRPVDEDALPMYAVGETPEPEVVEVSPSVLVAPWVERHWHSEIRSDFTSTMRYYNGWAPWYGSGPKNWTWWNQSSLKATFGCTAEYSNEHGGTVVTIYLSSAHSAAIYPNHPYYWDLESARPAVKDEDDIPIYFDCMKTWIGGRVSVYTDWTLNTRMQPVVL
jgi:hypothetical protein